MTITAGTPGSGMPRSRPNGAAAVAAPVAPAAAAPAAARATAQALAAQRGPGRLPAPPRERRPVLVTLGVLLVAGGALSAGLLALGLDERSPALVAARDIAAGEEITADALTEAPVAADGVELIPAGAAEQVIGTFAVTTIPAGRLLDTAMLARSEFLGDGQAAVGLAVPPGRLPAEGLRPGDRVAVVSVPQGGPAREVSGDAVVSTVGAPDADGALPAAGAEGDELVTLVVPESQATDLAAAAVEGSFSVVLLERGG
ncbi:MAG: SAF domain-containing protein [Kineosporiaceae bacterium]